MSLLAFLLLRPPFALEMGAGAAEGRLVEQERDVHTRFHPFAPEHPGPLIKGHLRCCLRFLWHHHAQHLVCVSLTTNLGN